MKKRETRSQREIKGNKRKLMAEIGTGEGKAMERLKKRNKSQRERNRKSESQRER